MLNAAPALTFVPVPTLFYAQCAFSRLPSSIPKSESLHPARITLFPKSSKVEAGRASFVHASSDEFLNSASISIEQIPKMASKESNSEPPTPSSGPDSKFLVFFLSDLGQKILFQSTKPKFITESSKNNKRFYQ